MSSQEEDAEIEEQEEEEEVEEEEEQEEVEEEGEEEPQQQQEGFDDDDEEAYKRSIGDFKPGTITKIVLKNFMTHAEAEVLPGPRYVSTTSECRNG
jgi:hypothetical protein